MGKAKGKAATLFGHLYFQVILGVLLGILIGVVNPGLGGSPDLVVGLGGATDTKRICCGVA